MSLASGKRLRLVGLLIEAISLFGFVAASRLRWDEAIISRVGLTNLCAIGLGIGFFVWAPGTGVIYREKAKSKSRVRSLDL